MKSALEGITALDLSRYTAGSYAALLLAEQGVNCIKIEPKPNGKRHRQADFALFNRSKKSLALDITQPEGVVTLERLARQTDVIILDYRPTRVREYKIGYKALAKNNPGLIYCSITSFGEKGPLKNKLGGDGVVSAFAGTQRSQGGMHWPPVFVYLPLGSYAAAMLGAYGVSLALYAREYTGRGQKVDTSLLAGDIAIEAGAFIFAPTVAPAAVKQNIQQGILPGYRLYRCKDGKWIMLACGNTTFWNKCCMALDRVDLISDPRFEGMPWAMQSLENRRILTNILTDIFNAETSQHWVELFDKNDVPCAPVNLRHEFVEDPQVAQSGMIIHIEDYYLGKMRQMGVPITLQEYPPQIKSPAPREGQHSNEILKEFGFETREITGLKKKGII
ncbi:MAG: CoA transferase [Dehalococcoidales bacterium]|nr:CoA transferase [Dehalococcoidales bacterium]